VTVCEEELDTGWEHLDEQVSALTLALLRVEQNVRRPASLGSLACHFHQ
jgi:hypothetical protein